MKIDQSFTVAQPPHVVYLEVNDVERIGSCIAGVQEIEVLSEDESRWKLQLSAGFMAMGMDFSARIVERRPPAYVGFEAKGQNVTLTGHIAIKPDGNGGSECAVIIDAQPQGPLAPLVDQMGRGIQQQLANKTIANIRERLSLEQPEIQEIPQPRPPKRQLRPSIIAIAGAVAALIYSLRRRGLRSAAKGS